jgi:hypothetical protein
MSTTDFDKFIARQQQAAAEGEATDWEKERDDWLAYLDSLHTKIRYFLRKYVDAGQVKVESAQVILNEENIGHYEAPQIVLRIGGQQVILRPVGTLLVGAKGRVDVEGPAGRATILLVNKRAQSPASLVHVTVGTAGALPATPAEPHEKIEWEWKIVTRPPERRFIEITQESFFQLIMEVANG